MSKKLTQKQENFCQEYVICGNASSAYRKAYNSVGKLETTSKRAYELLQNPVIKDRIDELKSNVSKNMQIEREDIINNLKQVVDKYLLDGRLTTNALKAIEILNKMLGWKPDKHQVEHKGVVINIIKPKNKNNEDEE